MTIWRPASDIRVKALGLQWRGPCLLAAEVYDDAGTLKGVRPLGGSVEFGEPVRDTVVREFREELDIALVHVGAPFFMENLYEHEGATGHEIIALCDVQFPAGAFDGETRLTFYEDNGVACFAQWFDVRTLDTEGHPALFPSGLKAALQARGLPA